MISTNPYVFELLMKAKLKNAQSENNGQMDAPYKIMDNLSSQMG